MPRTLTRDPRRCGVLSAGDFIAIAAPILAKFIGKSLCVERHHFHPGPSCFNLQCEPLAGDRFGDRTSGSCSYLVRTAPMDSLARLGYSTRELARIFHMRSRQGSESLRYVSQ